MMIVDEVKQQKIKTNGIWMNIAEKGTGPLVLLLHGFPEFWFSWRHQIRDLAQHGYHVVAPDLRGFGDTDSPTNPASYTMFHIVGDLIGVLDHFNAQQAFVVGSDWGAVAAWHLALFRPDRVKGVVCLSAPFMPRNPIIKPTELMKQIYGEDLYICQFQEPDRAERSFSRYDYETVIKKFLLITNTDPLIAPTGVDIIHSLETPYILPNWIIEEEIKVFANKFKQSGFTGGLNYYRAMDLNWELLAPWQGSKITVPAKLIVGDKEMGFESAGTEDYIKGATFKNMVPNCEVVIINGHHFIHQEKAHIVSEEILSFIRKVNVD